MEKRISEKDSAIIYTIRKNCRFHYENDWEETANSLPKAEWRSEETFSIKKQNGEAKKHLVLKI